MAYCMAKSQIKKRDQYARPPKKRCSGLCSVTMLKRVDGTRNLSNLSALRRLR